ncbi:uncharacterized protein IWZ02DRAFT_156953 [Phyllosticta citriasiana]|uniref:uncharacterized protein n=1 Tax=Phyllosticta citriasiana TaxID=595635 RepID=UPI0030FDC533
MAPVVMKLRVARSRSQAWNLLLLLCYRRRKFTSSSAAMAIQPLAATQWRNEMPTWVCGLALKSSGQLNQLPRRFAVFEQPSLRLLLAGAGLVRAGAPVCSSIPLFSLHYFTHRYRDLEDDGFRNSHDYCASSTVLPSISSGFPQPFAPTATHLLQAARPPAPTSTTSALPVSKLFRIDFHVPVTDSALQCPARRLCDWLRRSFPGSF